MVTSCMAYSQAPQIFTSEDVELPRQSVVDFLDSIDRQICARYLEFLINERKEVDPRFHDRLAESYLTMTLTAKKKGNSRNNAHNLSPPAISLTLRHTQNCRRNFIPSCFILLTPRTIIERRGCMASYHRKVCLASQLRSKLTPRPPQICLKLEQFFLDD